MQKEERYWRDAGVNSVPAFIVNQKHLISGAQEPGILADTLLDIATETQSHLNSIPTNKEVTNEHL